MESVGAPDLFRRDQPQIAPTTTSTAKATIRYRSQSLDPPPSLALDAPTAPVGDAVKMDIPPVGAGVGADGDIDGIAVGTTVGWGDGLDDGTVVGLSVGRTEGLVEGTAVGGLVAVGDDVGEKVGAVGARVGVAVGVVGALEGGAVVGATERKTSGTLFRSASVQSVTAA